MMVDAIITTAGRSTKTIVPIMALMNTLLQTNSVRKSTNRRIGGIEGQIVFKEAAGLFAV